MPRCPTVDPCLAKRETWIRLEADVGSPEASNDKKVTKVKQYRLFTCVVRPCQQWSPPLPIDVPLARLFPDAAQVPRLFLDG